MFDSELLPDQVKYTLSSSRFCGACEPVVNWLPLSVRMVLIFIGAARFNRRRKSELLLLDWSR